MQNYATSSEKSNIFQQMRDWNANRARRLTNSEVDKIVKLRSDKTHVDEALLVMRAALVFVTLFTSYCGFMFYQSTFIKVFSPTEAWIAAVGLAIITEAAKIFLLHRFLRSIFFGWISADWWSLGGWLFIGALAIGAYIWSIQISTDGMEMLTKQVAEASTPKDNLAALIKENTADIDAQIAASQGAQSAAINTKWKGTTTWRAQKSAASSGAAIASLQEQRATIVSQVTNDYQTGNQHREENISPWAYWIERYGGYMELVAALCIIAGVFFERRLVAHNMKMAQSSDFNPAPSPTLDTTSRRTTSDPINGHSAPLSGSVLFQNTSAGPVRDSVTLSGTIAAPSTGTDGDFIRLRLKSLKGWDDNFGKSGNKSDTVANNMCKILNEIGLKMTRTDFRPDENSVDQLLTYITETGFPTMDRYGYKYKYEADLIRVCREYLPAKVAA